MASVRQLFGDIRAAVAAFPLDFICFFIYHKQNQIEVFVMKNSSLMIIPPVVAAFVVASGVFNQSYAGTVILAMLVGIYFFARYFSRLKQPNVV